MSIITSSRRTAAVLALALSLPALVACNEEERGRAMHMEKGTYMGPADTPLSDAQKAALKDRASSQRF